MIAMTLALGLCLALDGPPSGADADALVERFVQHVEAREELPDTARAFVRREWTARRAAGTLDGFIPEALAVIDADFRAGLDACADERGVGCIRALTACTLSADPYVAVHAGLLHVEALIHELEIEYADLILEYLFRDDMDPEGLTLRGDQLLFLRGYCQLHTFQPDAALETLTAFLNAYPQASAELRGLAEDARLLARERPTKEFPQAVELMEGAGSALSEGAAGTATQLDQVKALAILEELIAQAEAQEQQQSGSGSGQSGQSPSTSNSPATESGTPGGEGPGASLGPGKTASPAEVWGRMRPQERARVLQSLQERFPSRYRDLVEQYYEELGKQTE